MILEINYEKNMTIYEKNMTIKAFGVIDTESKPFTPYPFALYIEVSHSNFS